ncbi:MAG: hypothetical protein ACYC22_13950 [Thiomonas delicata]|jgi:hypothetical protein
MKRASLIEKSMYGVATGLIFAAMGMLPANATNMGGQQPMTGVAPAPGTVAPQGKKAMCEQEAKTQGLSGAKEKQFVTKCAHS